MLPHGRSLSHPERGERWFSPHSMFPDPHTVLPSSQTSVLSLLILLAFFPFLSLAASIECKLASICAPPPADTILSWFIYFSTVLPDTCFVDMSARLSSPLILLRASNLLASSCWSHKMSTSRCHWTLYTAAGPALPFRRLPWPCSPRHFLSSS